VAQLTLDTPVRYVKGVGPARAEQLATLGIETVEDLLTHFPRRFDLRRQATSIAQVRGGEDNATVAGTVVETYENRHARRPFFQIGLEDETGCILVKWFHGGYLRGQIQEGMSLAVSGKVSVYREQPQFVNPRWQVLWGPAGQNLDSDELLPVYPAGGKLTSAIIGRIIHRVLPQARDLLPRWFDRDYLAHRGLPARPDAIAAMHRPEDRQQWEAARRRLAYDECLVMQLGIALLRQRQISRPAHPLPGGPRVDERIRARFPFPFTAAQNRAIDEIRADLARNRPMNRLLQGDVGAGKTVVALYAALVAVAARRQVAILAPTEILAAQHYRKIQQYLEGSRVRTALLIGGQRPTQRARTQDALAAGNVDIAVGTHALLGEGVRFRQLGLVVVDEQHRFGVRQRSSLRGKGTAPHYLVMTATPIPRTLALTVFGDLDVSVIDELPPGRGRTETRVHPQGDLPEVYRFVRQALAGGQQAFLIYPLVSPSPDLELTAAEDAYRELSAGPLRDVSLGLIHGQMPARKKEAVMAEFRAGRIQALVASSVVEVGLDVATANVMVVQHAERFGLAQLHQLRGRIGRGRENATCLLVASPRSPLARQRLEVLARTADGFKIAEEDLRLRGPGEFFGTRQHGLPELKVADLIDDFELLRMARRDAAQIVDEDPTLTAPHHRQLRHEVQRAYAGKLQLLTGG